MHVWLCPAQQIEPSKPHRVRAEGRDFLILQNTSGQFFVTENMCSHARVPLHTGHWDAAKGVLTCAAHGAKFDLAQNGKPLCAPAFSSLNTFECCLKSKTEGGELWVVVVEPEEED
jgi:nitrite reductase/ring-hydroxylating ferredoxin subunit